MQIRLGQLLGELMQHQTHRVLSDSAAVFCALLELQMDRWIQSEPLLSAGHKSVGSPLALRRGTSVDFFAGKTELRLLLCNLFLQSFLGFFLCRMRGTGVVHCSSDCMCQVRCVDDVRDSACVAHNACIAAS